MARVVLGSALARWLDPRPATAGEQSLEVPAATLREALDAVFSRHPGLRGYVLDEHGDLRHHLAVFVDGVALVDKRALDAGLGADAEVWVMQALSGG